MTVTARGMGGGIWPRASTDAGEEPEVAHLKKELRAAMVENIADWVWPY
jgi:hypothetical protein